MRVAELTGRMEAGVANETEVSILRGLTPVTKLASARWAVAGAAEAMESLGGVGYCEDSGLPALVRNTHVLPIWEGTTNVLSLDLLRSAERSDSVALLLVDARSTVAPLTAHPVLADTAAAVTRALDEIEQRFGGATDRSHREAGARSLALSVASTYACARLCAQGAWAAANGDGRTAGIAARLAERGLIASRPPEALELAMDEERQGWMV